MTMKRFLLFLLLAVPAPLCADDKKPDAKELAREIAPYLDDQLLGVVHIDLTNVDPEAAGRALQKAGLTAKQIEQAVAAGNQLLTALKGAGLKRGFAVMGLTEIPDQPPLLVIPLEKEGTAPVLIRVIEGVMHSKQMRFEKRGSVIVGGTARTLKRLADLKPVEKPELAEAFERLGDATVKVVVMPSKVVRKAFAELAPTLPRELGGGP